MSESENILAGFQALAAAIKKPQGNGIITPVWTWAHKETISANGINIGDKIWVGLANTDEVDENTPETIDLENIFAICETQDTITIFASFKAQTTGPINILWSKL